MWLVEEQRGPEALESLAGEWRCLETRCRHATAFQSQDWLIPWWSCFAHGELRVVTVRHDGRLRAALPLLVEAMPAGNRVTLLGTGNSDHLDLLVDDRCRDVATAMAIDRVAQSLAPSDWCDFEQLPATSPLLTTPAPFSWEWTGEQCDVCPTLAISNCGGSDPVPARRSADARYALRRLSRLGAVEVDIVRRDALDEALAALFVLHRARWTSRHLPGVLADSAVMRFLRCIAEAFLARGLLRVYTLRLSGRIVAVHFGFQWCSRRCYYIGGFDPELGGLSIGSVLLEHAIRDAITEGATEFDFLRGAEPYKYRWGATDRPSYRRVLRRAVPT
jgi:CelD/BcsL family acetyltransferase involved in cellulose biosynthesis